MLPQNNNVVMKKTFIFLLFLASFCGFSQGVTIDPTYTAAQLINGVLINSPCTTGTNINSSTGTNFGSTNGLGYFENLNPNFPFAKGIVLTTGDVTKVPSPNNLVLSDGTNAWPGDADLEANLLSQSGVTINSINASWIEFDFVASTANLSFDFIFASEEYGTSQCNYSDAFAFLLKNVTTNGPNSNIALVPGAPANTPVTVATIRDALYNGSCPSANPNWFGSFNGSGFGPAINFNGQTKKMTASATGLIVGNTYRIKIVIADGSSNTGYDSAIFLNANSFNTVANVLGPDLAFCSGATLPTLQPSPALAPGTTYQWKRNGNNMPAQTNATLNLNTATPAPTVGVNVYTLTYTQPGCSALSDDVNVEIYAPINALPSIPTYYLCNTSGPNFNFDLTKVTTTILTSNTNNVNDDLPADTQIKYYLTSTAANLGSGGELSSPHTITIGENNKVLYARIQNPTTLCYEVRSFMLSIVPPPTVAAIPANITLCARNLTDPQPTASFDTEALVATILGGAQSPTIYRVTYHSTQTAANLGNGSIIPRTAYSSPSRNLWIRVTLVTDPTCYAVSSTFFQLIVTPLPEVDILPDVVVCTSFTLPTLVEPGAQYFTQTNGGGTPKAAGDVITGNPGDVITIHVFNQAGTCKANDSFKITIMDTPADVAPASAQHCTQYALPTLPYGKYYDAPNAGGNLLPDGHVLTSTTTLYYHFENNTDAPFCTVDQPFTITIIPFVELVETDFPDQFACTSYNLPAAPANVTYYNGPNKTGGIVNAGPINATKTIYAYRESNTTPVNCTSEVSFTVTIDNNYAAPSDIVTCASTTLPALAFGEYRNASGGGGSVIPANTVFGPGTNTVWFYVPGESCTDNLSFTVTVSIDALPPMPDVGPVCDVYYLPAVPHTGDYFTGPGGTGTKRPVGFPITSSQTIYFYDKAATGTCFVENDIVITINPSPPIDARPIEVIRCNTTYTLDPLTNGHYYALQGGPGVSGQTLLDGATLTASQPVWVYSASPTPGNTCFQEYKIDVFIFNTQVNEMADVFACDSYTLPAIVGPGDYYTAPGGPNGTGTIVTPGTVYTTTPGNTTTTTLYIYAENNTRVACSDEKDVVITVYSTPVVAPITPVVQCDSYTLPPFVAPATKYFTLPNGAGIEKFPGDLITATTTIYAYAQSGTAATTLCIDDEPFSITINNTPVIAPIANVYACDSYALPALVAPATAYFTTNDGLGTNLPVGSLITSSQTVYVYAETGTTPNCFVYSPMNITIYNTPVVAPIIPVIACDSYALPALVPPATKYFTLPNGGGVEKFVGDLITSSQIIYSYAESGTVATQLCTDDEPLDITINVTPVIAPIQPVFACDSYILPAPTAPATEYLTANDGTGTVVPAGTLITTSTTLYPHAETATTPNCEAYGTLTITITPTPVFPPAEVADVNTCNSYTLPALSIPGANYYTGPNGTGSMIAINGTSNVFTTNTTVYAYAVNGTAPNQCTANEDIVINIYNVDEPAPVTNCGPYNLSNITLNAPGAAFYSLPGGVSPISVVTATQNVYVYGVAPSGCSDEFMFSVTINANAVANPVPATLTTVCDLDSNVDDFVTDFDLDSLTATILGAQNPAFYTVEYYPSLGDATVMTNKITTDNGPATDTRLTEIWVRVSDGSVSGCEDIERIVITVIPQPHLEPMEGVICFESQTGTGTPYNFVTGYSSSYYTFDWKDADGNTVSTAANYIASTPGTYTLVITAIGLTGCESAPITATVIESSKPADVSYEVVSGWFTENQTVKITAVPFIGTGSNFRYSIDGQEAVVGSDPDGHTFTNVNSGPHEITVFDINGCGSMPVPIPIQMVYSPKFFSPNGDGVNDVWKIQGFEYDPTAKLYIFDRFGKLLKEVFVNNNDGWDGSINGQPLPGNDYWFTIRYTENGISKEYKSHFALIR